MAQNFLAKCPAYKKAVNRKTFLQMEVVVRHLQPNYKVGNRKQKAAFKAIQAELAKMGVVITESECCLRKRTIRHAFLWLCADPQRRREIEADLSGQDLLGIRCLVESGKDTWQKLGYPKMPRFAAEGIRQAQKPRRRRLITAKAGAMRASSNGGGGQIGIKLAAAIQDWAVQKAALEAKAAQIRRELDDLLGPVVTATFHAEHKARG